MNERRIVVVGYDDAELLDIGLTVQSGQSLARLTGPLDTVLVSGGGPGVEKAADDPVIVGHVRRLARNARRVASVCTGAAVLAAAGLQAFVTRYGIPPSRYRATQARRVVPGRAG